MQCTITEGAVLCCGSDMYQSVTASEATAAHAMCLLFAYLYGSAELIQHMARLPAVHCTSPGCLLSSVVLIVQPSPDSLISTTLGTPAFMAPEMCGLKSSPFKPFPAECWALGASLFMFVYGRGARATAMWLS